MGLPIKIFKEQNFRMTINLHLAHIAVMHFKYFRIRPFNVQYWSYFIFLFKKISWKYHRDADDQAITYVFYRNALCELIMYMQQYTLCLIPDCLYYNGKPGQWWKWKKSMLIRMDVVIRKDYITWVLIIVFSAMYLF